MNYCDSKELESFWAIWLYSLRTPHLDKFRESGLFATKVIDENSSSHVILSKNPIIFESDVNNISADNETIFKSILSGNDLCLISKYSNYNLDTSVIDNWKRFTLEILNICDGVSKKFYPKTKDEKDNLVQEAFAYTLKKIERGSLNYIPGKASVFNLLTTAIYRIMCTIKNKQNKIRNRHMQIIDKIIDVNKSALRM